RRRAVAPGARGHQVRDGGRLLHAPALRQSRPAPAVPDRHRLGHHRVHRGAVHVRRARYWHWRLTTAYAVTTPSPWAFHAHISVWVVMGSSLALYLYAIRRLRPTGAEVTRKQVTLFLTGWALLWIFSDWPIHDISERY